MTKRLRSIYHGYVQIAEIDATDQTAPYVAKTYRWDPSEPVATRPLTLTLWTREGTARETLYYAHDLRKNVVSLFDAKGLRRASYQYDPFGNITSMEGDLAESNSFRFSSEHHDQDLGLVYYNYRHYNPTDGRWTSRDPIAEKGGFNLYGFVNNKPIEYVDAWGLITPEDIADCIDVYVLLNEKVWEPNTVNKQRIPAIVGIADVCVYLEWKTSKKCQEIKRQYYNEQHSWVRLRQYRTTSSSRDNSATKDHSKRDTESNHLVKNGIDDVTFAGKLLWFEEGIYARKYQAGEPEWVTKDIQNDQGAISKWWSGEYKAPNSTVYTLCVPPGGPAATYRYTGCRVQVYVVGLKTIIWKHDAYYWFDKNR